MIYKCPNKCGDKRYPQPTWKTKAGYERHLAKCPMRPEVVAERMRVTAEREAKRGKQRNEALASCPVKIGERIEYVKTTVTHPTHEWRGSRRVRVRYEEKKRFEVSSTIVDHIDFDTAILINRHIRLSDICRDHAAAKKLAYERQTGHDEHLRLSAMCR